MTADPVLLEAHSARNAPRIPFCRRPIHPRRFGNRARSTLNMIRMNPLCEHRAADQGQV